MPKTTRSLDAVIVGAGPAGLGMGVTLRDLGMEKFVILDRQAVGASFLRWPRETQFITPSFNSNQFGALDLNAVCLYTSPAYSLEVEHPTGEQYAAYLRGVAEHFALPVETGVDVQSVSPRRVGKGFVVETSSGTYRARFVIWAAGEFQYPRGNGFEGADLCLHNSKVSAWGELRGGERWIIGGAESGADAAVGLAAAGRDSVVLDAGEPWEQRGSDPSQLLSPYTKMRLGDAVDAGHVTLRGKSSVTAVRRHADGYQIVLESGETLDCADKPILASGFDGSAGLVGDLFAWRDDGFPELTEHDESTRAPGLFLVGPQVRQGGVIFCFIYKFRQRFAVVANQLAQRLGTDVSPLDEYRRHGMYLDDLSCCGDECAC